MMYVLSGFLKVLTLLLSRVKEEFNLKQVSHLKKITVIFKSIIGLSYPLKIPCTLKIVLVIF